MIAIVDYGVGNLFSLRSSFKAIGADAVFTSDEKIIRDADRILLPGVGAFEDAADKLKTTGLGELLVNEVKKGKPLLGICLGMQLLFDKSYEFGCFDGLGLIPGDIVSFEGKIDPSLKIPEIGWNELRLNKESVLYKGFSGGEFVYFVHSYFADCESRFVSAFSEYDIDFPASVEYENVFGCQFHPEKSGKAGLKIIDNFCKAGFGL
ncbi:MAG: imidazole glycerol phosphate synthase subunit HisH [Ruminococcaceae bacterium]|nr:imidazole glycerol phosphate synthase subunit HisH [Oscillospiraceae bacterium]